MSTVEQPKYLRLSQEIEEQIAAGAWDGGRMPSLRGLAERHGVSVVTVARAVQVLRDKGLIGRTDRTGCYLARPDGGEGAAPQVGLCLRVTPSSWQRHAGAILRTGFDAVAAAGEAVFHELFDLGDHVGFEEMRRQVARAAADGLSGVLFHPSRHSEAWARRDEEFLLACAEGDLPVVLLERNLRGRHRPLERDLVSVDDVEGGFRCTQHLLAIGRRRVALVVASPCSSHEGRLAGYLQALHAEAESGWPAGPAFEPIILRMPPELPGKASDRWLADQLTEARADAVFCYQDSVAVGVIVELLSRGVAVPRDVAVCGFENLPIGDLFTIGVTTYHYPSADLVRAGLHVLRQRILEPSGPPLRVSIRGDLIVRESTATDDPRSPLAVSPSAR